MRLAYEAPGDVPSIGGETLHVFFELGDHLGSTSVVLDKATGELVERSTYQAYGGSESDYRPERWKHFREDYRFTGKEEDVEVGLIYFGFRFLNPLLNRWVSADPLAVHGLGADPNLYAYVSGRVVQSVDPLGLQEEATLTGPIYRPGSNGRVRTDKNAASNDSYSAWRGSCGADCEAADDAGWLAGDQQRQEIPVTIEAKPPAKPKTAPASTPKQKGPGDGPDATDTNLEMLEVWGGAVADSTVPIWAEYKDYETANDPNAPQWARGVATVSLTISLFSLGSAPNAGAMAKLLAKSDRAVPTARFADVPKVHAPEAHAPPSSPAGADALVGGQSIRDVNTVRGSANCLSCAVATDATLAGRPSSAIGGGPYSVSDILKAYPNRSFVPVNGYKGARATVAGWGPGSRGIVWGRRFQNGKEQVGHVFNVVNDRGKVRFLDGQTGKAAIEAPYSHLYVLRTD